MGGHHHHGVVHNLKVAFFLNFSFTIIEFVGGWWTQSIAILSDAVHDLGDTIIIGIAILLERWSEKKGNARFTYGYRRLSPLSGLLTSLILVIGAVIIFIHAIPRLINPIEVHATGMFFLSILGIGFNGLAVYRLKENASINQKAIKLHLVEDLLGWISILLGSILIYIFSWYIIDPLLSILIAIYIIYQAGKNLKKVIPIFLQASPSPKIQQIIYDTISKYKDISSVKHVRSWTLDGERHIVTFCLIVRTTIEQDLLNSIKFELRQKIHWIDDDDITIEVEYM